MALGDVIGRLSVVLGLDTAAFETGAKRAAKTTKDTGDRFEALGYKVGSAARAVIGIGAAIAGSQVVGQLKDMALASLEAGKQIDLFSKLSNASVGEFQRAAYAAKTVGIESEKLADIFKDVNDKVGDFLSTGGGEMADFFTNIAPKVGVTAEQFRGLSGPAALQLYVSSLEAANLSQAEMTFYLEAIANDATRLLPLLKDSGAEMQRLAQAADTAGIILSESEIQASIDGLNKYQAALAVAQAKQAKFVAANADGVVDGLVAWENFKTEILVLFGKVAAGYKWLDDEATKLADKIPDPLEALGGAIDWIDAKWDQLHASVTNSMQRLYQGVKTWLMDKLDAVWKWLAGKVEQARQLFFNLYDAVVGHSYIPDMVDEIGHHIGRLDENMVKPIEKATARSSAAFAKMAKDVLKSFGKLDTASSAVVKAESGRLRLGFAGIFGDPGEDRMKQLFDPARGPEIAAARKRFRLSQAGINRAGPSAGEFFGPGSVLDPALAAKFKKNMDVMDLRLNGLGLTNVKVAKTFKDLADSTLSAIDRMAKAFSGGSFLDKLGAVIGLGLQLGSIGVFGKGFQSRMNAVPGFAQGTSFAPGGLAMVGERGPELVNLPKGSRVIPNHALGGMGGMRVEVVPSPFFDVRVQQNIGAAAPGIASAGARAGEARMTMRQNRRVA